MYTKGHWKDIKKQEGRKRKFVDVRNKFEVCRELKSKNDGRKFCN
jgi:hypothetical protein